LNHCIVRSKANKLEAYFKAFNIGDKENVEKAIDAAFRKDSSIRGRDLANLKEWYAKHRRSEI
jgi:hypothetical protein